MAKHPGKTPAQRTALDEIGCGNHSPMMANATREKLLRDGLIIELPRRVEKHGVFRIEFRQFDMPTHVHIQWCDAMSDEE